MENFNIENAKTRFFESKEHYLNFKQAWKDFHNNERHIERGEWTTPHGNVREYKTSLLDSSHYMLYNLLRGYDIKHGFSEHSEHEWAMCYDPAVTIARIAAELKDVNSSSKFSRNFARKRIGKLLLPFGGYVTYEALRDLGEQLHINVFNNQNFPQFEIEEWKEIEEPKKMSLKERLTSPFA